MVSRRNFFTITVIMLVVWFMFQIPEVVKNHVNNYGQNEYEKTAYTGLTGDSVSFASKDDGETTGRFVVFIGDEGSDGVGSIVKQWCFYTKRYLQSYTSIKEYEADPNHLPEAVLVDSHYLDVKEEFFELKQLTMMGVNIVFCNLPDVSVMKNTWALRDMLGIRQIVNEALSVEGIRLMDGFLLGGQKEYILDETMEVTQQDLRLYMPWYRISAGTKMFMCGIMEDEDMEEYGLMKDGDIIEKNRNLPAIIWRSSYMNAMVFAVNGDYLSGHTGLGILSALMLEMKSYDIYPVINAQNLVVLNFPDLTDENEDEMMERYSQSLKAVYRDIVWPGLVSVAQQNSYKMTCMIMPQMEYMDNIVPEEDMLVYYMKLFQEQGVETGLSGTYGKGMNIPGKLDQDIEFLNQVVPDYTILSFYQGNISDDAMAKAIKRERLSKIQTLFTNYNDKDWLVSYYLNTIVKQSGICNGYSHTFSENLRMVSIETALGYSNIQVDVNPVAFPISDEDSWEKLARKFAGNTSTYWKKFKKFQKTTLTESNAHVRRFLALDYTQERTGDMISLHIDNFNEEAWFILRTHGEDIKEAVGATFEKMEDDAYLITATDQEVQLKMEEVQTRYYYK